MTAFFDNAWVNNIRAVNINNFDDILNNISLKYIDFIILRVYNNKQHALVLKEYDMKQIAKIITLSLCSFLILGISGCKVKPGYDRQDTALYDDAKVSITNLNENLNAMVGNVGAGSTNYLLYGYNVINYGYVDSQNINKRYAILDATKLLSTDYSKVDSTRSDTTYLTSNQASSLLEKFNISTSVKYKSALFSGNMKAEYGLSKELDENEKLIKYLGFYRVYEQYLTANNTRIKELITDQFKQDLANPMLLSDKKMASGKTESEDAIDTIFNSYGTHLIQEYYLGGRFDLNFNFTSSTLITEEDLKASVEATYASFSGSATAETKEKAKKVTEHSSLTFKAVGGMLMTGTTPDAISQQFKGWLDSLKTANDICEIGSFDAAMLPIWELADNAAVKTRLQQRFSVLLEEAERELQGYDPKPKYISDIIVVADENSGTAMSRIPSDYTKVCLNPGTNNTEVLDANRSVGGDFIFIAYKLTTDKSQAIYNIEVGYGKDKPDYSYGGHDYEKINVDLNKGAGGDYIYLFYSKATATDTQFIKEIRGVYGASSIPSNWQWTRDKVDLNKGAGGYFIYLAYRTGS
jgi:hypothetical protein